ncbi:MAG: SCO1664 family protein [Chloroflexota bacterium]|nr:MAG: hypothetical protein DLM70_17740 [Chloroflexota bacterium]
MERPSLNPASFGYQGLGQAWDPHRPDITRLLRDSEHATIEPIYFGSNHCFLVTLEAGEVGRSLTVYKPGRGEYPLYDFPTGTLYRREAGSWLVDRMLGWSLVPPTVISHGRFGPGSVQLFIESYSRGDVDILELQRLALLDLVLNNADRKSDHCLLGDGGKLWAIDHGLTFHVHPKLRTVLWHFAGERIPPECLADVQRLLGCLETLEAEESSELRELLSFEEWRALIRRTARLAEMEYFPDPRHKSVPYRW